MILKIARYKDKQQWWIYDDIRKISISDQYLHNQYAELPYDSNWDAVFFDVDGNCNCDGINNQCDDCVVYYVLGCRLNSGEEYFVAFDTIAYILNDNGKTIEKIVANYDPERSKKS